MSDYAYTPLYYNGPTQVRFYDWRDNRYHGGIGYHDFIISGTSEVLIIEKIIREAAAVGMHWDDAIIELDWLNLDGYIWGTTH